MGSIKFVNGATGRSLQLTLLRIQPASVILCARINNFIKPLSNIDLLKSSNGKFNQEFRLTSSNKILQTQWNLCGIEQKYFKHTLPSSPKEKDVRNFVSSVVERNSIEKEQLNKELPEEWNEIRSDYSIKPYLSLAKIKLTSFVMMTSMAGYAVAPGAFDITVFLSCSLGVLMTSSAANAINQIFEVPYDSQMSRTMNRPLVKGLVTPQQAMTFAGLSGSLGVLVLLSGANLLTASLGLANVFIYTMLYTPMKRTNIANTWMGSVVGAIPPMMGWAAATGQLDAGAWLLGAVLFAWQFPHFNALSWNLQSDYSRAGYRMMSVVNPDLCRKVALRYSLVLTGLSVLFPICDVTSWGVTLCSAPVNLYLNYLSWKFYSDGDSASARKLFKFSLVYLPLVLTIIIAGKKRKESDKKSDNVVEENK